MTWKENYAVLGCFDVIAIVASDDPVQVKKAVMIIRAYGHATTETLSSTPREEFLETLL